MRGLDVKIKAVEKHAVVTELGTAVFVGSAQMILKLGIATVALVGGTLLAKGEISVLTFFMFLLVVSRIYDPMQVSLQNLAAIISSEVQSARLDEILSHEVQEGSEKMDRKGYDIEFSICGKAGGSNCTDRTVRWRKDNRLTSGVKILGRRSWKDHSRWNGYFKS